MCFRLLVIELWAKSILTILINFLHLRSDPEVGDSRAHAATQQWLLYDSLGPFLMVTSRLPQLQASHPHLPIHKADRREGGLLLVSPLLSFLPGVGIFPRNLPADFLYGDWVTGLSIGRSHPCLLLSWEVVAEQANTSACHAAS